MYANKVILNQHSGILTVAPNTSGFCNMIRSNDPFDSISLIVMPIDDNSPYTVDVYFYGRLEESHSFPTPTGEYNCFMTYPDLCMPANLSTHSIPHHFDPYKKDFIGIPILLSLYNSSAVEKSFYVYALFKTYGTAHAEIRALEY